MGEAALPLLVLVESDPNHIGLSLRSVKDSGIECDVTVIRDESAAIKLILDDDQEVPHLFVLEYRVGSVDPTVILKAIRSNPRMRNVPVVIHAAREARADLEECSREGANSLIEKPIRSEEFIAHLGSAIRYWLKFNRAAVLPEAKPWS